jgi:hypothetical protein
MLFAIWRICLLGWVLQLRRLSLIWLIGIHFTLMFFGFIAKLSAIGVAPTSATPSKELVYDQPIIGPHV